MQEAIVGRDPALFRGSDSIEWDTIAKCRYTSNQQVATEPESTLSLLDFGLLKNWISLTISFKRGRTSGTNGKPKAGELLYRSALPNPPSWVRKT